MSLRFTVCNLAQQIYLLEKCARSQDKMHESYGSKPVMFSRTLQFHDGCLRQNVRQVFQFYSISGPIVYISKFYKIPLVPKMAFTISFVEFDRVHSKK